MFQSNNLLLVIILTVAVSCSNIKLRHHDHHASNLWDNTSEDISPLSTQILHHTSNSEAKINNINNKNTFFDIPSSELATEDELSNSSEFDDDDFFKFHKSQHNQNSVKNCKTCQNGVKMTEEELTALRIEFVKNQILKKLRLTERPNVSIKDLPKPITEKLIPDPETENVNRQVEDYYGKTTKKFIFLQEGEDFGKVSK